MLGLDTGFIPSDVDEFNFVGKSFAIEVNSSDVEGCGHRNQLCQQVSFRSGNIPYVGEEAFHAVIQDRDLGKGFPQVV